MKDSIKIPNPLALITNLSPKVKIALIICFTLVFLSVAVPIGRSVVNGNLDGQDLVNIIEAFKGGFEAPKK